MIFMDRLVASAAGMAATLYLMAACVAWMRAIWPKAAQEQLVRRVILDRAAAWTGLAVLFTLIVLVRLKMADWTDALIDIVLLVAILVVYCTGLLSVRAITVPRHGYRALIMFAGVSLAVGIVILFA